MIQKLTFRIVHIHGCLRLYIIQRHRWHGFHLKFFSLHRALSKLKTPQLFFCILTKQICILDIRISTRLFMFVKISGYQVVVYLTVREAKTHSTLGVIGVVVIKSRFSVIVPQTILSRCISTKYILYSHCRFVDLYSVLSIWSKTWLCRGYPWSDDHVFVLNHTRTIDRTKNDICYYT